MRSTRSLLDKHEIPHAICWRGGEMFYYDSVNDWQHTYNYVNADMTLMWTITAREVWGGYLDTPRIRPNVHPDLMVAEGL